MMRRRGIFIAEVAIALGLVGFIAVSLSIAVVRQNKAASQLAETREAIRLAEQALLSMQAEQVTFPRGQDIAIQMMPSDAQTPVPDWKWVRVEAQFKNGSADLTGLVREDLLNRATAGGNP